MQSRAVLEVNLSAVRNNVRLLRGLAGWGAFFCPMLKASAYGMGAVPIAKILQQEGVKQVGVINTDEAWNVRSSLPDLDILVYDPLTSKEELLWLIQENLAGLCSDWESLKQRAILKKKARIHLKFDTGFSRLGFAPQEAPKLLQFLKEHSYLELVAVASHLLCAEELADKNSPSYQQLKTFWALKQHFPNTPFHLLNTAGLISQYVNSPVPGLALISQCVNNENSSTKAMALKPDLPPLYGPSYQGVNANIGSRPGIGLYGIKPKVFCPNVMAQKKWKALALQPSSSLKSHIVGLRELNKGDLVSYGSYRLSKKTKVATVSMGYFDGFPRAVNSQRSVLLRGKKRSVIGTVCMDYFMIELQKDDEGLSLGEEVTIFDTQGLLPVEEQAQALNTIPYELFTGLGPRVKRIYTKSS